jgi:hypothetical protein
MKKKTKKTLKRIGITLGILAIILLLLLFIKTPVSVEIPSGTSSGGSTGGSGGSSTTVTEDTPLLFVPFTWFDFSVPTIDTPAIIIPNIFPTLKSNGESCTSDSQCSSDYCNLGLKAVGKCETPSTATRTEETLRNPYECSRSSDCNKCANPDYDTCVSGKCECVAPPSCTDTDKNRDGTTINYQIPGNCVSPTMNANDFCSGEDLVEYSCVSNECVGKIVDCSFVTGTRNSLCYNGGCGTLV